MSSTNNSTQRARKLTPRLLCELYNVVPRTIDRWVEVGILPKPLRINRYRYWDQAEIEQREREGMSAAHKPNTAA